MIRLQKIKDSLDISKSGYKINKIIFRCVLGVIALMLVMIVARDGVGVLFKSSTGICCPETELSGCHNPFYQACDSEMCENRIVPRGVCYGGSQPSFLTGSFGSIVIFLVIASLLLNHLLYNRKYKFGGEK
jgi:hypothetical protein